MEFTKVASFLNMESLTAEQQAALKLVEDLVAKLKGVGNAEIKLSGATSSKEAAKELANLKKEQTALTAANKAAEKSLLDLAKAQKLAASAAKDNAAASKLEAAAANEAAKAALNEAKAETENQKQKILSAKYTNELEKAKGSLQKATDAELRNQDKLNNAYEQLKAKYNIAANTAKRLAAEQLKVAAANGLSSEEYKQAAEFTNQAQQAAQRYYVELVKIEDAVGQSQRKVGQYTNATFALTQILREAPSFAYSFQTGLLGISNNIPILVDEIQKLNKVTNSGLESFKILAKSLFSINNIITLVVGALTIFGPKLIEAFTGSEKLNESQKRLLETEKQLNDVFKERVTNENTLVDQQVKNNDQRLAQLEKEGHTQKDLFSAKKKNLETELFFQGDLTRQAAARAEQEDDAKERGLRGIEAIQKAREQYDVMVSIALGSQFNKLKEIAELEKEGKSTKSQRKDLELIEKQLARAKSGFELYNKVLEDNVAVQNKYNNVLAEEKKFNIDERRRLILESTIQEADLEQRKNNLILASDRSTLADRLDALKKNYAAQKAVIEANRNNVLTDPTASDADRSIAVGKANKEILAAQLDLQAEVLRIKEEFRLRDLQAQKEAYTSQLSLQADVNKTLAKSTELELNQRLDAQEKYVEASKRIAEAEYIFRLQQAGLSDSEIAKFRENNAYKVKNKKVTDEELIALAKLYENEILQLTIDSNTTATEILEAELGKQRALREENVNKLRRLFDGFNVARSNQYAQETIDLNKALIKNEISYTDYLKKRAKLDKDYAKSVQRTNIEFLEDQLAAFNNLTEEETAARKRLADLRTQFTQASTDAERQAIAERIALAEKELAAVEDDIDKKLELERKLADEKKKLSDDTAAREIENREKVREAEKKFFDEALSTIEALGTARYTRESNEIQRQIDLLEDKKAKEIEVAEATATSSQDAADRVAVINSRSATQREQLERRQRQIEAERAKFAKAIEISRIIGQTAVGVINALSGPPPAPPNPFLAAIIGATGALQLARVISTPIPRYSEGLDEADRDHWAYVGDGGRREYVKYPDGSGWITPDKPTLTFIPKGASVAKSLDEAAVVGSSLAAGLQDPAARNDLAMFTGAITREMKLTRLAIMNKRENHWTVRNGRTELVTKDGYNETTYLNENLGF
jgi:hypothetical protein